MPRESLRDALGLYLVADLSLRPLDLANVVQACIESGVTCVQLRAKHQPPDRLLPIAQQVRRICAGRSVPLIVNDDLDLALAIHADGVHVGVDDVEPETARSRGGDDFVIGFSPETDEQIRDAETRGVSYLGIGPLFETVTKPDAGAALGVVEFRRRLSLSRLPAVAIGGIVPSNARSALETGAEGIAVVSAILGADDPGHSAAVLRSIVDSARTFRRSRL